MPPNLQVGTMSVSPSSGLNGSNNPQDVTIPRWVAQLMPMIALIVGTVAVFVTQRSDVEQLKTTIIEMKAQQQVYVTKQVFDIKTAEYDKYFIQMNARFDKLEGLLSGLYERLPAKQPREK